MGSPLSDALYELFSWFPNPPTPEDRARVAKALASALPTPPAPADDASGAEAMRERAASILDEYAKNAATLSKTPPEEGYEDRREEWAGTASMLRALATQMRRLPLPARPPTAADAVVEAARAVIESVRPDFWDDDPPTNDTEVAYAIDYALLDALRAALRGGGR